MPSSKSIPAEVKFETWSQQHPGRAAQVDWAHRRVNKALRSGRLVRASACEECGATDRKIDAAHLDYSVEKILSVRWLCRPCHSRWDRAPKTSEAFKAPRRGGRKPVTVCAHGHAYTPENTYRSPNGTKMCRVCLKTRRDRERKSVA